MTKRVLLAGISHETHTFLKATTPLTAFRQRAGEALYQAEGDASVMAGALEAAKACGWQTIPVIDMDATPSGIADDDVLERFWGLLCKAVQEEMPNGIDGVYLAMHGAMVCRSTPDVEGEILRRLQSIPTMQGIPICGALDLHGNYTDAMANYSHGLIAYRENPHTDARETAKRAALLLDRLMRSGERPKTLCHRPPMVLPPTGVGTADDPMRSLEARAREIEAQHPEILAINIFAGFSFADIPETGLCFSAITLGDPTEAQSLLKELGDLALSLREKGNVLGVSLEEAIAQAKASPKAPVLIVEPADNIGGGAPGDLTIVLEALLQQNAENALACINDPEAVEILWELPIGSRKTLAIGGKSGELGAFSLLLEVEILSHSDGRFTLEDLHSHAAIWGAQVAMGRCVAVRHGGICILLTSAKTPPFDLAQFRSQGLIPESFQIIAVKAAVAHRRAYDPIAAASHTVDTEGPCASNLKRMPYRHIRRPIYPLDDL